MSAAKKTNTYYCVTVKEGNAYPIIFSTKPIRLQKDTGGEYQVLSEGKLFGKNILLIQDRGIPVMKLNKVYHFKGHIGSMMIMNELIN